MTMVIFFLNNIIIMLMLTIAKTIHNMTMMIFGRIGVRQEKAKMCGGEGRFGFTFTIIDNFEIQHMMMIQSDSKQVNWPVSPVASFSIFFL